MITSHVILPWNKLNPTKKIFAKIPRAKLKEWGVESYFANVLEFNEEVPYSCV